MKNEIDITLETIPMGECELITIDELKRRSKMIKPQEFIIKKLNTLFGIIEGIKIRYEYRKDLAAHFIEILPLEIFNDEKYCRKEMEILEEFDLLYAHEEIIFISSESLCEIENAHMVWKKNG